MGIDYGGALVDSKIREFYDTNDIGVVDELVSYTCFNDIKSTDAFLFLLNETKDMPPLKFEKRARAQHAIWVAKCASVFLEKNKINDNIYLYSALWHDLIEDSLKNKKKKANSKLIEEEANILINKINGTIDPNLVNKVFNIVKKLTKDETSSYINYVEQMYVGDQDIVNITSFIKNCDMIINCNTCHVFSSMKQIRQFLKYFKKLNIDRSYLENKDLDNFRLKLIYDSNLELCDILYKKLGEALEKYEKENGVSDEGKEIWRQLAKVYGDKYDGYNSVTSAVSRKDIILNPVKVFDGTISTFKFFLEPYESIDTRKEKELKFHNEGRDYVALVGLWNLAGKFCEDHKFHVKGF